MLSVIVGIIFIGFCVFSILGLQWSPQIIEFLKGFAPCLAAFCGVVSILIGLADIKDKSEAKKEEAKASENN